MIKSRGKLIYLNFCLAVFLELVDIGRVFLIFIGGVGWYFFFGGLGVFINCFIVEVYLFLVNGFIYLYVGDVYLFKENLEKLK